MLGLRTAAIRLTTLPIVLYSDLFILYIELEFYQFTCPDLFCMLKHQLVNKETQRYGWRELDWGRRSQNVMGYVFMHACRAILTNLSCLQSFRRIDMSVSPSSLPPSLCLCTPLITLNIFMLYFYLFCERMCCNKEQYPIYSLAMVLCL